MKRVKLVKSFFVPKSNWKFEEIEGPFKTVFGSPDLIIVLIRKPLINYLLICPNK